MWYIAELYTHVQIQIGLFFLAHNTQVLMMLSKLMNQCMSLRIEEAFPRYFPYCSMQTFGIAYFHYVQFVDIFFCDLSYDINA